MRGLLIGLLVFGVVVLAGFGTLAVIANGLEPSRESVSVELEDNFPR